MGILLVAPLLLTWRKLPKVSHPSQKDCRTSDLAAAAASTRLARLLLAHPRRLRPLSPRILTISPSSLGGLSIRPALHGPLQLHPLRLRHLGHSPKQRPLFQTRQQYAPSTVIPASLHRRHRRHRVSFSCHRRRTQPSRSLPARQRSQPRQRPAHRPTRQLGLRPQHPAIAVVRGNLSHSGTVAGNF